MKHNIVFVLGLVAGLLCAAFPRDNTTHAQAPALKGESKAQLQQVVAAAETEATDEVDQTRVSPQAREAVKEYHRSMQKDAAARGPLVHVDETKTVVTYANAYRIHMTPNEIVFDLGFNMPKPNSVQAGREELLFTVSDRIVMTSSNAKRFQASLASAIKGFEDRYGEISPPREDAPPEKP